MVMIGLFCPWIFATHGHSWLLTSTIFGFPRMQKIGVKKIGFEKVTLERNADKFGREFCA